MGGAVGLGVGAGATAVEAGVAPLETALEEPDEPPIVRMTAPMEVPTTSRANAAAIAWRLRSPARKEGSLGLNLLISLSASHHGES